MTDQKELIPMMPGDILRHERIKQGLTLEKVAARSRIRLAVLEAIESSQTSEIPSVYLRGHIRHYALFLNIDPQQLDQHMEHVSGVEPVVRSVFEFRPKRGNADKWLKATSYLVASALVATLAWQFTHEAVRFSQSGSHLNASMASMELLDLADGNLAPEGLPEEGPAGHEAGKRAVGQPYPAINSDNGQPAVQPNQTQQLKIETSADTWIEVLDAAGQHLEMDLLRAGTSREYRGKAPFSVMLGRASAVEVWFNGQAVDLASHTRGNVARLTLGGQLMTRSDPQAESLKP
ncbi:MAG: RodZ domain-containing protein [Xanthomonadales bacterium]